MAGHGGHVLQEGGVPFLRGGLGLVAEVLAGDLDAVLGEDDGADVLPELVVALHAIGDVAAQPGVVLAVHEVVCLGLVQGLDEVGVPGGGFDHAGELGIERDEAVAGGFQIESLLGPVAHVERPPFLIMHEPGATGPGDFSGAEGVEADEAVGDPELQMGALEVGGVLVHLADDGLGEGDVAGGHGLGLGDGDPGLEVGEGDVVQADLAGVVAEDVVGLAEHAADGGVGGVAAEGEALPPGAGCTEGVWGGLVAEGAGFLQVAVFLELLGGLDEGVVLLAEGHPLHAEVVGEDGAGVVEGIAGEGLGEDEGEVVDVAPAGLPRDELALVGGAWAALVGGEDLLDGGVGVAALHAFEGLEELLGLLGAEGGADLAGELGGLPGIAGGELPQDLPAAVGELDGELFIPGAGAALPGGGVTDAATFETTEWGGHGGEGG